MSARWAALLRLAQQRFGLRPVEVWALSLAEWRALTAPDPSARALRRAELDALLLQFPDDPA